MMTYSANFPRTLNMKQNDELVKLFSSAMLCLFLNFSLQKPTERIPIYVICRIILAFRLVLTYDLLEDRLVEDRLVEDVTDIFL